MPATPVLAEKLVRVPSGSGSRQDTVGEIGGCHCHPARLTNRSCLEVPDVPGNPKQSARFPKKPCVAQAAFPNGNVSMQMCDVLGAIYEDASFVSLFATRSRPAETPWRLALVTVMPFAEGLSDRKAAEAVRARIDWKYALGLPLTDAGFDFSVLSESARDWSMVLPRIDCWMPCSPNARNAATSKGAGSNVPTRPGALWAGCSGHCGCSAAWNAVATAAPDWLQRHTPAGWFARDRRRIEEYCLPKGKEARQASGETVGADGIALLTARFPRVGHSPWSTCCAAPGCTSM